jgi:serine/threonine protein kinase
MYTRWGRFIRAWADYPLPEGNIIGRRYRVIAQIGIGSYGMTYRCLDEQEQQEVAVKQAKPSKKGIGQALLAWEREIIAKMDHLFIPSYRDYIEEGRSAWLVTDYVDGNSVRAGMIGIPSFSRLLLERPRWPCSFLDCSMECITLFKSFLNILSPPL